MCNLCATSPNTAPATKKCVILWLSSTFFWLYYSATLIFSPPNTAPATTLLFFLLLFLDSTIFLLLFLDSTILLLYYSLTLLLFYSTILWLYYSFTLRCPSCIGNFSTKLPLTSCAVYTSPKVFSCHKIIILPRHENWHPNITATSPSIALQKKVTLQRQLHYILSLPRKATLQLHAMLPLPPKVTLQHHCNFTKQCPCNEKWHWNFTKYCVCHEKWHCDWTIAWVNYSWTVYSLAE